jgi:hypothetical protein
MRTGSLNGEQLVDGLGDTAARLKADGDALRAATPSVASDVEDLERGLTRLRGEAQAIEVGGGGHEPSGEGPEEAGGLASAGIARRLDELEPQLRSIRRRLGARCAAPR